MTEILFDQWAAELLSTSSPRIVALFEALRCTRIPVDVPPVLPPATDACSGYPIDVDVLTPLQRVKLIDHTAADGAEWSSGWSVSEVCEHLHRGGELWLDAAEVRLVPRVWQRAIRLQLRRGGELYDYVALAEKRDCVLLTQTIGVHASDEELSLTWADATRLNGDLTSRLGGLNTSTANTEGGSPPK